MHFHSYIYIINICVYLFWLSYLPLSLTTMLGYDEELVILL